jgi:hypothetical protein
MAPGTYPADRPTRWPRSDSDGNARSKHREGVPRTPGQYRPPPLPGSPLIERVSVVLGPARVPMRYQFPVRPNRDRGCATLIVGPANPRTRVLSMKSTDAGDPDRTPTEAELERQMIELGLVISSASASQYASADPVLYGGSNGVEGARRETRRGGQGDQRGVRHLGEDDRHGSQFRPADPGPELRVLSVSTTSRARTRQRRSVRSKRRSARSRSSKRSSERSR